MHKVAWILFYFIFYKTQIQHVNSVIMLQHSSKDSTIQSSWQTSKWVASEKGYQNH